MNLLTAYGDKAWSFWTPRKELSPKFEIQEINGELIFEITSNGDMNNYGVWQCSVSGIEAGKYYKFNVEYIAEHVLCESVNIYALVTWMDDKGNPLERDYIDKTGDGENGWKSLWRLIDAPPNAAAIKLELALRWSSGGTVSWRRPSVVKEEYNKNRKVKVATTYVKPSEEFEKNLASMLEVLDKAGRTKPDIICLTETLYEGFVKLPLEERCQSIPGMLTQKLAEKAAKYNSYVIFTMYEKEGNIIYNTAVLLGRDGQIAGKYRKMHLPLYEAEMGVTPGNEYGIFDVDFGRIGIMTCYDQMFPETARILSLQGAEIIFVPTIGDEPLQTMARARDNGIYVVVSGCNGPESSRIINPMGDVISSVSSEAEGICSNELDLNKRFFTHWLSVGPCNGESKSLFRKERRADTYDSIILL